MQWAWCGERLHVVSTWLLPGRRLHLDEFIDAMAITPATAVPTVADESSGGSGIAASVRHMLDVCLKVRQS